MKTSRKRQAPPSLRVPPSLRYRSGIGKQGSKKLKISSTMASAKPLRMRQWLEDLLDNNKCKGVAWVSKEDKTFEIPWCHASRHDFDTREHADVFIQYAEFTGKRDLVDGIKDGYNSKLKSNFRSALRSLVDCVPVNDLETGRPKGENAVKVFRFLDPSDPECVRKKKEKINSQRNSKKQGTRKSKSREKPEVNEEAATPVSQYLVPDVPFPSDEEGGVIILPAEAEEFIANSNNNNDDDDDGNPDSIQCVTSAQMIHEITYSAPPKFSSMTSSVLTHSTETTNTTSCSDGANDNSTHFVPPPTAEIDLSSLQEGQAHSLTLPNFIELGVEDTFDTPICHSNQSLKSGGIMRVRKENKLQSQLLHLTELRNVELPLISVQNETTFECTAVTDNSLFLTETASVLHHDADVAQNVQVEESNFPHSIAMGLEGDEGFSGSSYHVIQENNSVTVVKQNPATISQGENYNLYEHVGKFQHQ